MRPRATRLPKPLGVLGALPGRHAVLVLGRAPAGALLGRHTLCGCGDGLGGVWNLEGTLSNCLSLKAGRCDSTSSAACLLRRSLPSCRRARRLSRAWSRRSFCGSWSSNAPTVPTFCRHAMRAASWPPLPAQRRCRGRGGPVFGGLRAACHCGGLGPGLRPRLRLGLHPRLRPGLLPPIPQLPPRPLGTPMALGPPQKARR